jgi:hypothetical protein
MQLEMLQPFIASENYILLLLQRISSGRSRNGCRQSCRTTRPCSITSGRHHHLTMRMWQFAACGAANRGAVRLHMADERAIPSRNAALAFS